MARDFETVWSTRTIEEADLVAAWLRARGVAAQVKDENTAATYTWGMTAIAPHGIEIVAPPAEAGEARALLARHWEDLEREAKSAPATPIEAACESCGMRSTFPATLRGKVADCPHCGALVDVPEE